MKKFLIKTIVLQILIIINCPGQIPGWEIVQSNTSENLNSIYFYDYQTGFACGDSGVVLKTLDSGKTWQSLQSPVSVNLNDCFMFSPFCITAVGDSGIMIQTRDGGDRWSAWWLADLVDNINCITFIEDQYGYGGFYGADSQAILIGWFHDYCIGSIIDNWGGHHAGAFWGAYMIQPGLGFVVGENSLFQPIVARSNGYGIWEFVSFTLNGENGVATGVAFTDSLVGYISARVWDGREGIAKTTNSGYDWTTKFFSNPLWSINFPISGTNQVGYCVGDAGTILKTFNAGESWYEQTSGTYENLNKVFFVDPKFGFIVGDNGIILRTTTGGGIITQTEDKEESLNSFELQQNYPNPFNPVTKISWQSAVGSWQTLKIFDVIGNQVAALVDEYKPAGSYEVEWDANEFPSGIYFYQLISGNYIEAKKMVLLR